MSCATGWSTLNLSGRGPPGDIVTLSSNQPMEQSLPINGFNTSASVQTDLANYLSGRYDNAQYIRSRVRHLVARLRTRVGVLAYRSPFIPAETSSPRAAAARFAVALPSTILLVGGGSGQPPPALPNR